MDVIMSYYDIKHIILHLNLNNFTFVCDAFVEHVISHYVSSAFKLLSV